MTLKANAESFSLQSRLNELESAGVRLFLNGLPSNTEHIIANCVNEETVYMPDYVTDEKGKIREIRYDRIY